MADNIIPFPGKAALSRAAALPGADNGASALRRAVVELERALESQNAALHGWRQTIESLARCAEALAVEIAAAQIQLGHDRPVEPEPAANGGTPDEP